MGPSSSGARPVDTSQSRTASYTQGAAKNQPQPSSHSSQSYGQSRPATSSQLPTTAARASQPQAALHRSPVSASQSQSSSHRSPASSVYREEPDSDCVIISSSMESDDE